MEPRFNMFDNEIGAKFGKRFAHASLVIAQSPLPKSAQELAALALAEEGTRLADAYRGCPTRPGPSCASTTTTIRSPRWSAWSP